MGDCIMSENTLGERIKSLRRKAGLTQLNLAYRIYISESYIALIEANKRNPSTDVINALAEVFHVSVDYLVNGEEDEADKLMFKEWFSIVNGRSEKEIKSALAMVKSFFDCIDDNKE